MSLAQRVNDLADAVGRAIKDEQDKIPVVNSKLESLQEKVTTLQTTLIEVKELLSQITTKVYITDVDPGEGSELETNAAILVIKAEQESGE